MNTKTAATATKNYGLFSISRSNRPIEPGLHKDLLASMQAKGFDPDQPILCFRDEKGKLVVWDGQHRLHFARLLGITVWYRVTAYHNPREFNSKTKAWSISDYIHSHIGEGNEAVSELQAFKEQFGLPATMCEMLLAGRVGTACGRTIKTGEVRIKDRAFAHRVASTISAMAKVFSYSKEMNCVTAVARFCRVPQFIPDQLIAKLTSCPGLLVRQATVEQYSAVLEEIYNRDQKRNRLPIKFMADEEMKKRNRAA